MKTSSQIMTRKIRNNGKKSRNEVTQTSLIALRGVQKVFQSAAGEFTALNQINLEIDKGEFIGIIGRSGSGKSTLINMISGIDRPTTGEVIVSNAAIHKMNENQIARWRGRNLGIVFQFFQLLPTLTVIENVMLPIDFCGSFPMKLRRERALQVLDLVEMRSHAHKLPASLSGGQQQRVAIARALVNDPPIIIADEPTGNLDTKSANEMFQLFEKLTAEGKTIVMVTHDNSLAQRVHRTIMIMDGEIVQNMRIPEAAFQSN